MLQDLFIHATLSSPYIYGKNNFANPINVVYMPMALTNEASIHAMVAFAGYHQSRLRENKMRHSDYEGLEQVRTMKFNATFHFSEAIRLMNEKLKNPSEALSNLSIITTCQIGACSVKCLHSIILSTCSIKFNFSPNKTPISNKISVTVSQNFTC